jgi:pimeloyl-ACP methyl ester carboxylesterase
MQVPKALPIAAAGAVLIGLAAHGLPGMERAMIYHPDAAGQFRDAEPPAPWRRVAIVDAAAGVDVFAWHVPAAPGRPTTLWLHGNADSVEGMRGLSDRILQGGAGALLVSYRGYGGNPGNPTEEGLTLDAKAGLDWLVAQGIDQVSIVAHSLGTGVAAGVAALDGGRHVDRLVLFAPFTDLPAVAQNMMPFVPVRLLMRDRYQSLEHLAGLPGLPVLVVHGTEDRIVPVAEGRRLAASLGARSGIFEVEGAGHMPFSPEAITRARQFLRLAKD